MVGILSPPSHAMAAQFNAMAINNIASLFIFFTYCFTFCNWLAKVLKKYLPYTFLYVFNI